MLLILIDFVSKFRTKSSLREARFKKLIAKLTFFFIAFVLFKFHVLQMDQISIYEKSQQL